MMRRFCAGLVGVTICLAVGIGAAQQSIPPGAQSPVAPSGSTVEGQEVEGKVRSFDRAARTITLDNGEEYVIAESVNANWDNVKEGTTVRMRYGIDGGRNTAVSLEVRR